MHIESLSTRDNKCANDCIDGVYIHSLVWIVALSLVWLWVWLVRLLYFTVLFNVSPQLQALGVARETVVLYSIILMGHLSLQVLANVTTHICHGLGLIVPNMNTCVKIYEYCLKFNMEHIHCLGSSNNVAQAPPHIWHNYAKMNLIYVQGRSQLF